MSYNMPEPHKYIQNDVRQEKSYQHLPAYRALNFDVMALSYNI